VRPEHANAAFGYCVDDPFSPQRAAKKLLIIGGGYIACEFVPAIHERSWVEVTQYYRGAASAARV